MTRFDQTVGQFMALTDTGLPGDGVAPSLLKHHVVSGPTRTGMSFVSGSIGSGKSLAGLSAFAKARHGAHKVLSPRDPIPQPAEMLAMARGPKAEPRRSALLLGMLNRIGK